MPYILALLVILGTLLSFTLHHNPLTGLFERTKAAIVETITPKTRTEVIIDNVKPQQEKLDRFFKTTMPNIAKSEALSREAKMEIQAAIQAFEQTQEAVIEIRNAERAETGIIESIIKKVVGSEPTSSPTPAASTNAANNSSSPAPGTALTGSPGPSPTVVPAQCRVECSQ